MQVTSKGRPKLVSCGPELAKRVMREERRNLILVQHHPTEGGTGVRIKMGSGKKFRKVFSEFRVRAEEEAFRNNDSTCRGRGSPVRWWQSIVEKQEGSTNDAWMAKLTSATTHHGHRGAMAVVELRFDCEEDCGTEIASILQAHMEMCMKNQLHSRKRRARRSTPSNSEEESEASGEGTDEEDDEDLH